MTVGKRNVSLSLLLAGLLGLCAPLLHAQTDSFIRVTDQVPDGFIDLSFPQVTEADVFYGGEFVGTAMVEYSLLGVTIDDPLALIQAIPGIREPERLAGFLQGLLPSNAGRLCTSRTRSDCGELSPAVVDIIFDDSRFRLDVFVNPNELLVHRLAQQKYLPDSTAPPSFLSDIRVNMAGTGDDRRFNLGSESYLSRQHSRLYSRYGFSDDGLSVYELSWQHDARDYEYEIGSFDTLGKHLTYANDLDVLGVRIATSTKTRADLDDALTTPVLLFLSERSRVDVFRGDELISSRFYDAGNQQIDTRDFPDGAYDLTLRVLGQSGREFVDQQFFVRSTQMPPEGEPQYYFETGTLVDTYDDTLPRVIDAGWLRLGSSHRLFQHAAWDNEVLYSNSKALVQTGLWWLDRQWQGYAGVMASSRGDLGFSLRGGFRWQDYSAHLDLRHVNARHQLQLRWDDFDLVPESYTQAIATVAMPLAGGRLFLRGRVNHRASLRENGIGFSYWRSVYRQLGVTADLSLDGHYADDESWIRLGVTVRWQRGRHHYQLTPRVEQAFSEMHGDRFHALADGRFQASGPVAGMGDVDQIYYFNHDRQRSAVGAKFVPHEYPLSDFEIGVQRQYGEADLYYTMNNRFSVAAQQGRTTVNRGNESASEGAAAVLINITGNTFEKFAVVVDDRVVGYARAHQPTIISLRPYESYDVRIRPAGEAIVGYDASEHQVTLYPGNVVALDFTAAELTVVIGQAIHADGSPVANARFDNVEGYGATDQFGWFQIEVTHDQALLLQPRGGVPCRLSLPDRHTDDGLLLVDTLVCEPIPAPL